MTRQDRLLLRYLQEYVAAKGRMPTYKEACADLDMARGQLYRHLNNLVDEGKLELTTPHLLPFRIAA